MNILSEQEIKEKEKLDTMFVKIISNKSVCSKYGVVPGAFSTLRQGLNSENIFVKAIAESICEVDKALKERERKDLMNRVSFSGVLEEVDLKAVYRKIVSPLVKS